MYEKSNQTIERSRLLTEREVSRIFSVSLAFLRRKRFQGDGPRYYKIGRMIRYRLEDVQEFFDNYVISFGAQRREDI